MSTNPAEEYQWRETYFILFSSSRRPTLAQVEDALSQLGGRVQLQNMVADDEGSFESLMLRSPEDYAALEISYETGDAVVAQRAELAKQLKDDAGAQTLQRLMRADSRLDVMHFERVTEDSLQSVDEDEFDEMLDPTCLLMAVEALTELTEGIAIDPASGEVLE
ncbi:MAG: hypothetical protein WDZ59_10905 [Pirellulales bacterium]